MERSRATYKTNLIGAINGDATSVAIIVDPFGSKSISGDAINEYISETNGIPAIERIANKAKTFSNLDLSSMR